MCTNIDLGFALRGIDNIKPRSNDTLKDRDTVCSGFFFVSIHTCYSPEAADVKPRAKTSVRAILLCGAICRRHTIGIGKTIMAKSVTTFSLPTPRMTGTRVGVCRFWLDSRGAGVFVLPIVSLVKLGRDSKWSVDRQCQQTWLRMVQIPWHDNRKRDLRKERPAINWYICLSRLRVDLYAPALPWHISMLDRYL